MERARTIAVLPECQEQEKGRLQAALGAGDRLIFCGERGLSDLAERDSVDVVFGEPELADILRLPRLRWIQMTWAGANKYTAEPSFPRDLTLTSASGAFGMTIAEYVIAGVLALYRLLFSYRQQLQGGQWQELEGENTLEGKRAVVLGIGNVGQETAKRLKAFACSTVGISRRAKEKPDCFDELHTMEELDDQLALADLVILTLPGTEETRGLFGEARLRRIKRGALLVNVGRGFIVDTEALTKTLKEGRLGGAVLDVMEPEPLPPEHPLRHMEKVLLTPHISGISWGTNLCTRSRILDIFTENLRLDKDGQPLSHRIDLNRGY